MHEKWSEVKVAQPCPTLSDPMDCTVHGILQVRILEWVVILFSRGSSQARDVTQVSRVAGGFFTSWATREAQKQSQGVGRAWRGAQGAGRGARGESWQLKPKKWGRGKAITGGPNHCPASAEDGRLLRLDALGGVEEVGGRPSSWARRPPPAAREREC